MTKDEAAQELTKMIHQYANGVATIEEVEAARDAYAQAAVDAALDVVRRTQIVMEANHDEGQYEEDADTLGMLEALAKMGDDIIWRGLQVRCIPETGYFLYFRPVRDVALATEQLGQDGMRHSEILAEIKRDLGDSPHG